MVQICNNNYIYADYQLCSQGCINGACADCKPGTSVCAGAAATKVCGADGKYGAQQNCATGYACTDGNCVQASVCLEGQKSCASNNVYICQGGQWAEYLTCPSGSNCVTSGGSSYCEATPVPAPTPSPTPAPAPEPQKDSGLFGLGMIGGAVAAVVGIGVIAGAGYFLLMRKK